MNFNFVSPEFIGSIIAAFFFGVGFGKYLERKRWIPGEVTMLQGISTSDEDIADRVMEAMRRGHPICQEITNLVGETACREFNELIGDQDIQASRIHYTGGK